MRTPRIANVVPAVLTPFREDLSIDGDALQELVDSLLAVGSIGAIFCVGHAGEVASLTQAERRQVVRLTTEAVGGRVPVLAGLYTDSISDAIAMANDARAEGAAAVTVFPPPIFADGGTDTSEMPYQWFERIAREAETPVVIFQFSRDTGLAYTPETLERLAELPQVVAIKEGSADMSAYERNYRILSSSAPPIPVLTSNNSWLLASLAVGGDGILSGSSNVVAADHARLWRAVQDGDLAAARAINDKLYPLVQLFYRPPFINMHTRMKEALAMMGVLPRATVRPPLLPISAQERDEIRQALVDAKMLQ
jgi:4-hydroxy-tetrahydrodipicolinate synthase